MNSAYVLITPAKNEGRHIERLIQSVVSQTIPPVKWVVVSDGSTDDTDAIVMSYQKRYRFIDLVRKESSVYRDFSSKVKAINLGLSRLAECNYQYIGNLDADASFDPDYYESILQHFSRDKFLGIAAGATIDVIAGEYHKTLSSDDSVGGIAQFFRRECWEQIGGYRLMKLGGEDSTAEIMARMNGWKVRKIENLRVCHHREMGTGSWGNWNRRIFQGRHFYTLGYHYLFFVFKCIYRMKEKPYVLGSLLLMMGYVWAYFAKERTQTPKDVVNFLQAEQMGKLYSMLKIRIQKRPTLKNC